MRTRQTILVLTLFFLMGIFAAQLPARVAQLSGSTSRYDFFDPIIDVYSVIDQTYVDDIDKAKLQLGAINGMLEALDDPYTQFVPPVDRAAFHKELTGQFVGIGAEVVIEGGYLTIVSPLEDSPAFNAGIRPGDKVVEIEGETTLNLSIDDCISRLTGEPGTPVKILVARGGIGGEQLPMTIVRERITPRAVRGVHRYPATPGSAKSSGSGAERNGAWNYTLDPENRIALIRLSQFTPTAADELRDALATLRASEPGALGGLILDLRGDPGGVLDAALGIVDLFLKEGVIVSVKGRAAGGAKRGNGDEVYSATAEGTLPDFPMIVLVNGSSASASEIVAGALADHGRAVVLGTRTFGKGLVQAVQPLRRPVWGGALGAQLKFTSQRYYLPSGRMIHRTDDATTWGVDPTPGFHIPMTNEEQLARLLERRDRDILAVTDAGAPGETEPARWSDPQWLETELKDKQLAAALRALQGRIASGEWTPAADVADAAAQAQNVNLAELRQLELGRERILRELERLERRLESLESAAAGDAVPDRTFDLWPDETAVAGGRMDVYDKDGNKITTLNITGENLERWLIDAGVEPAPPVSDN